MILTIRSINNNVNVLKVMKKCNLCSSRKLLAVPVNTMKFSSRRMVVFAKFLTININSRVSSTWIARCRAEWCTPHCTIMDSHLARRFKDILHTISTQGNTWCIQCLIKECGVINIWLALVTKIRCKINTLFHMLSTRSQDTYKCRTQTHVIRSTHQLGARVTNKTHSTKWARVSFL